jgi:hypothetical protein
MEADVSSEDDGRDRRKTRMVKGAAAATGGAAGLVLGGPAGAAAGAAAAGLGADYVLKHKASDAVSADGDHDAVVEAAQEATAGGR